MVSLNPLARLFRRHSDSRAQGTAAVVSTISPSITVSGAPVEMKKHLMEHTEWIQKFEFRLPPGTPRSAIELVGFGGDERPGMLWVPENITQLKSTWAEDARWKETPNDVRVAFRWSAFHPGRTPTFKVTTPNGERFTVEVRGDGTAVRLPSSSPVDSGEFSPAPS